MVFYLYGVGTSSFNYMMTLNKTTMIHIRTMRSSTTGTKILVKKTNTLVVTRPRKTAVKTRKVDTFVKTTIIGDKAKHWYVMIIYSARLIT